MERKEFISRSPSETLKIGEILSKELSKGSLVILKGELGSGKTQLVKGIAKGLGFKEWMYVVSPSFTLVNSYETEKSTLFHVDLYRLSEEEASGLFLEEMLDYGIVVIEWGEKLAWDGEAIRINIEVLENEERRITVEKD